MRSLQSLLTQLGSDVGSKLDVVSGRRPRILRDGEFRDVDEATASEDDVLDLCRLAGGTRELEHLGTRPVTFVVQGPRGRVRVTVVVRGRDIAASFVPIGANEDAPSERANQTAPKRVTALRSNSRSMRRPSTQSAAPRQPSDRTENRDPRRDSRTDTPSPRPRVDEREPKRERPAPDERRAERAPVEARQAEVASMPVPSTEPSAVEAARAAAPLELDTSRARPASPALTEAPIPAARAVPAMLHGSGSKIDALLLDMLVAANRQGASDLHLSAGQAPGVRVCGELRAGSKVPSSADVERALRSILPARLTEAYAKHGSACFAASVGSGLRVRVHATSTSTGPKLAIRFVHATPPDPEALGLPLDLVKALDHPQGLVLIVGPAGHGKTTTLASLVDAVNRTRSAHIVTLEDPVEIPILSAKSIVSQREVGTHTKSVRHALEGVLRQDPDVVAVGELDGVETMRLALAASGTGQLVIATLNASSGPSAIERVIDAFPVDEQPVVRGALASALRLVLCQRLVPTSDGLGRAVAIELLPGIPQLSTLIHGDKLTELPSLIQRGRGLGIIRMEDSVAELESQGKISSETARALVKETEATTEIARRDIARLGELALDARGPAMSLGDDDDLLGGLLQKAGAMFTRKGGS